MPENSGTILLVEDSPTDKILIKKYLSRSSFKDWEVHDRSRLASALEALQESTPDIILFDLSLPDSTGMDSYVHLRRNNDKVPVVVLTGMSDLELAKSLIKMGAQDYLIKGEFDTKLLEKAIDYAMERNKLKLENNHTKESLLDSVLEAQDQERGRIAKELHDGVVQSLTAVSLNIALLKEQSAKAGKNFAAQLEKCERGLAAGIDEIRNISHSLMPRVIAEMSLTNAIESLIADLSDAVSLEISFLSNFDMELDKKRKITIYRIVQELMNNTIKHAQANNLIIQLIQYADAVCLMLEDDGVGFDLQQVKDNKSCFGLQSIESRINAVGGVFEIDSNPGRGTNVIISIQKSKL